MNCKISIVGSNGIPAAYGGFETLVEQLVRNVPQGYSNYKLVVYCSGKEKTKSYMGATLKYVNIKPNGLSSIPYDIVSMIRSGLDRTNCILLLGCSGAIFIPFFKIFFRAKVITNVDGIEWLREKWSWLPSKFLKFSEFIAVRYSDEIISDNRAVADYIFKEYGSNSIVIPYGGDHIDLDIKLKQATIKEFKFKSYFLGICRIEPENNIGMVLNAFSKLPSCNIVFIGNWNNSKYGKNLKEKYGAFSNIYLLDPVYDQAELNFYRSGCSGYVHGHSAGGTNPSLVEAMYFSKYIICFDCNFNRYTTDNKALYFKDEPSLVEIIKSSSIESIDQMSLHKIAKERYNWNSVAKAYFELFSKN